MKNLTLALFLLLSTVGCLGDHSAQGQEVGPNGEPPQDLVLVYQKQFITEEKNYVLALGHIHAYLTEQAFQVRYTRCFDDVLDVRIRSKGLSCLALMAEKGPPTKVYFRVLIDQVLFNQLDHDNRLLYSLEMYVLEHYRQNGIADELLRSLNSSIGGELPLLYQPAKSTAPNQSRP